jgi:hypothetical protein
MDDPIIYKEIRLKTIQQQISTIAQATTNTRLMLYNAPIPRASAPTSTHFPVDCDEKPYSERDVDKP